MSECDCENEGDDVDCEELVQCLRCSDRLHTENAVCTDSGWVCIVCLGW